jgi:bacteriocin biosynthesis cyclodehydratase domain-containing protein
MATHTGGNRPTVNRSGGMHAGVVAGDQAHSTTRFNGKDVPQFAPNFSVYVLPPDAVCFYSEDRKFFLHGELFCIAADAIAAGKSFGQIVRELTKKFPADMVDQAIKRLIDRRYIVPKRHTAVDAAAGYWATLGIPLEMAAKNLQKCKVRVQSIDAKGAKQLGAALRKLGVRVVDRSADLTVVLVDDYLVGKLEQLNRQHLSDRTPWLLVQPSGVFPLVGPVFSPGKGPCWSCLAERMKRNREVRAMLDRRQARRVAVSPLARDSLGGSGIELAAVEIAKAIASDFRTPLNDHLVSLDLSGPTIVKHYVPRRPQCPSCGSKKLRDPRREPAPLELTAGAKPVMTSGGYRSVSSRATVAKYRKHVSPLTGVVSKLERVEVDLPLNTNYYATHNFSGPAKSIHELRSGRGGGGSFGKGSTAEQGEASGLMEAIERYSGIFQGDEIRVARRFSDFAPGDAIWPNDVLLFSEEQYRRARMGPSEADVTPTPPPFDPSAKIEWTPVWSLRDQRFKYLPTGMLYFFHTDAFDSHMHADSNGCAAGNTLEEAIVQGFLELVERDSYAIWWYNRSRRTELDLGRFDDSYVRDLKNQLAETGRRLWVLDITSDLGIPSYVAMSHATQNGQDFVEYGSGSHFDPRIALLRALTEVNQFLSLGLMGLRDAGSSSNDGAGPFRLQEHPYLIPDGKPPVRPDFDKKFASLDTREQTLACVDVAKRAGLDFLVLDQTRPDIETPVVRVIVPGLRHFYRRFAPGRLYDIPVKLGWRDRPISEHDLNPLHPQT